MDPIPLLVGTLNLLGLVLAAGIAFKLGRGAAREDRLRAHELESVVDTRDRLLDLVRLAESLANLETARIEELNRATRSLRYARARTALIADDRLIDLLSKALPQLHGTFPDVSGQLHSDLTRLGNVIRESMFDQETAILKTGKPYLQTSVQERRIDVMIEAVAGQSHRYRGWRKRWLWVRIWLRLTFGL